MRMKVWGEISGERHLVGTLETIPGREEQFSYAESYLESEVAQPLSVLLPLREGPFPARQTRVFFRNLLPEGGALAAVAKTLEVKSSSYLKVLNALGSECIGALVLESADEREDDSYGYEPLSREELGRAFEAGAEGVAKLQEEAKLSLAGAQSKMGLYVDRSSGSLPQYFLPQGTAASTHIVKAANRRFGQLSENEYYCLPRDFLCPSATSTPSGVNRSSSLSASIAWCFPKMIGGLVAECSGFNGFIRRIFARCSAFCRSASTRRGACAMRRRCGMCFTSALRIRCAISRRSCACWW